MLVKFALLILLHISLTVGLKLLTLSLFCHLSQFGTIKISQEEYLNILNKNNLKDDLSINKNLKKNILEYF